MIQNYGLGLILLLLSTPAPAGPLHKEKLYSNLRTHELLYFGDILRPTRSEPEFDDPALTSVTQTFGPTVITFGLPYQSPVARADVKPWSSWWFPKKDNLLFDNSNGRLSSALDKLDFIQKARWNSGVQKKFKGLAAAYERANYNPNSQAWEGLCDAWAIAAVTMPEPRRPVKFKMADGFVLTFSISELKGLLLKTYEAIDSEGLQKHGQKFTGDLDGWIQPDIYPEQFHRMIELSLFQERKAFVMDHDPGLQIWNVPLYKANFTAQQVANEPNSVFIRMWVYNAASSHANEKDFIGTKEIIREYNYILKGHRNERNELVVDSGQWVRTPGGVDSRRDHPDFLIRVTDPQKIIRRSWNPEIDVELIDEILAQSF